MSKTSAHFVTLTQAAVERPKQGLQTSPMGYFEKAKDNRPHFQTSNIGPYNSKIIAND